MSGAYLYYNHCTDHLQNDFEIYVFAYIDCASVVIFCSFHILADHKVCFNLMHCSTFIDSIFLWNIKIFLAEIGLIDTEVKKTFSSKS